MRIFKDVRCPICKKDFRWGLMKENRKKMASIHYVAIRNVDLRFGFRSRAMLSL